MEHIVQFAIGIDDEAIRERVVEGAYNDVVKNLMDEAKREVKLTHSSYYYGQSWHNIIDRALQNYFDENKELIIERAAEKLVDSYKRTKTFKEKMSATLEEIANE